MKSHILNQFFFRILFHFLPVVGTNTVWFKIEFQLAFFDQQRKSNPTNNENNKRSIFSSPNFSQNDYEKMTRIWKEKLLFDKAKVVSMKLGSIEICKRAIFYEYSMQLTLLCILQWNEMSINSKNRKHILFMIASFHHSRVADVIERRLLNIAEFTIRTPLADVKWHECNSIICFRCEFSLWIFHWMCRDEIVETKYIRSVVVVE